MSATNNLPVKARLCNGLHKHQHRIGQVTTGLTVTVVLIVVREIFTHGNVTALLHACLLTMHMVEHQIAVLPKYDDNGNIISKKVRD